MHKRLSEGDKHEQKEAVACLTGIALFAGTLTGCAVEGAKTTEPITLTVWTYYSGEQLDAFNELVDSFNDT